MAVVVGERGGGDGGERQAGAAEIHARGHAEGQHAGRGVAHGDPRRVGAAERVGQRADLAHPAVQRLAGQRPEPQRHVAGGGCGAHRGQPVLRDVDDDLGLVGVGEAGHRLAGAHHLADLDRQRSDDAVGVSGEDAVGALVAGQRHLAHGLLQPRFGHQLGGDALVVFRRHEGGRAAAQRAVAAPVGRGVGGVGERRLQRRLGRLLRELQVGPISEASTWSARTWSPTSIRRDTTLPPTRKASSASMRGWRCRNRPAWSAAPAG